MGRAAAKTGIMPTALVAIEQSFPPSQRIIEDALALRMLPPEGRMFVGLLRLRFLRDWLIGVAEKSDPGMWGGLLSRKRFIDDRIATSRDAIEAVVSLGAGFDPRSFRLPSLAGVPIWEIDQRENIEAKEKRLRQALGDIPGNVRLVAVDFDHEDPGAKLALQGYSMSLRTFFVWEGVTQYLTEAGVRATMGWLEQAAPGSRLAFTYVRRRFLKGEALYGWESGYRRFVKTGVWRFGMEPEDCPAFLREYGWELMEELSYEELGRRWFGPTGRTLAATEVERMVYAEKR